MRPDRKLENRAFLENVLSVAMSGLLTTAYIFFFVVFLVSLSAYWGWLYFRPICFYLFLLFAYFDQAKKDGGRYSIGFSKAALRLPIFTKYLGLLVVVSTVGNILYFVRVLLTI